MNVILIVRFRHEKVDAFARENFWIECCLHGVARPKQGKPLQVLRFGSRTRCFDDADQWNRRLWRNVVEHDVRRICSDQSEIGTRPSKLGDSLEQIIGHASKIVCGHEIESLLQINAVNDEFRITPVASALAIKRDDPLIIIDRALRPEATDDSESFHFLTTNEHEATEMTKDE